MGKTLGLLLIVIASALLIYWIVAPSLSPASSHRNPQIVSPTGMPTTPPPSNPQDGAVDLAGPPVSSQAPLAPPRTPQQQANDAIEARRAPYYDWIRKVAADKVFDVAPADDDGATLVVTTRADTPDMAPSLARDVIYPYAFQYGFRHVRFFVPNGPGSVERYRFDAEANCDNNNNWTLFKK